MAGKSARKGPQTGSLSQQAIVNTIRTSDAIVHAFDALFKKYGLTMTQYNVLRVLRGAGARGASCSGIAERLIKAEPDVTRLLDRLERRGWVRRERDVKDRRTVKSWITIDGLKLLRALDRPVGDLNTKTFMEMKVADVSQLISILEKIREALK